LVNGTGSLQLSEYPGDMVMKPNFPLPFSLTDQQMQTIMAGARTLPVEKRSQYLQRIAAMLEIRGRFSDGDVTEVAALALVGLVHQKTDAA
jgi:hypothetical protein